MAWEFRYRGVEAADAALDDTGMLHVVTRSPGVVEVFDSEGRVQRSYGLGLLSDRPHAVTVAPGGTSYVVDEPEHVVHVFDAAGTPIGMLGTPGRPSPTGADPTMPVHLRHTTVSTPGLPFNHPTKVALVPDGTLLVSDGYGNSCIHHLDPGGRVIRSWGTPGAASGQLMLPHGVVLLADGRVAVADRGNHRVQFFDLAGAPLGEWSDVRSPCAIAQGPDGTVWVTELATRVDQYDPASPLLTRARISGFSPGGEPIIRAHSLRVRDEEVPLVAPHGIAVSGEGVVVAEVRFSIARERSHTLHVFPELVAS